MQWGVMLVGVTLAGRCLQTPRVGDRRQAAGRSFQSEGVRASSLCCCKEVGGEGYRGALGSLGSETD